MTRRFALSKILFASIFVVASLFFCFGVIRNASATESSNNRSIYFHGIDISGKSGVDLYYLRIPLTQLNSLDLFHRAPSATQHVNWVDPIFQNVQQSNRETYATFLFEARFNNMQINGRDVFIQFDARIRLARRPWWNMTYSARQFWFLNPDDHNAFYISLSNNFYQVIRAMDHDVVFNSVSLYIRHFNPSVLYHVHYNPSWFPVSSPRPQTVNLPNVTIYTRHAPPPEFDIDDPDFNPDAGNTGSNTVPDSDVVSGDEATPATSLWDLLARLFNTTPDVVQSIAILLGLGIALVVSLPLVTSALKR